MSLNLRIRANRPTFGRNKQLGLSIIELLIGVVIGIFIVGGAISLFLTTLDGSRRMLLEARLHQDLRTAADIVTRDLRRAGYWSTAVQGITGSITNPNRTVTATANTVTYTFDAPGSANQQVIFSLSGGKIRMQLGNADAQDLTDPSVMTVTQFAITARPNTIALGNLCNTACAGAGCPSIEVRRYDITIEGQSVADASIVRRLETSVRVRNDNIAGSCPV